jgi:protoporphyrinogen oxidase
MAYDYAILGGGVLGLTAALRLAERGHAVTVFEREAEPGGLAAGFRVGQRALPAGATEDLWLEKFYHHLFKSDTAAIALIDELGLGDRLEWRRPLTVTLRGGHVYQLDSPASVLRFTALSLPARLRMGAALALLKLLPTPAPLEGRTTAAWLRTTMGQSAYETVWEPLLRGKFGAVKEEIALPWFWARVHDRTAELGYVRGGFQHVYNRLAQRLRQRGGDLRLATAVQRVEPDAGRFTVTYADAATPDAVRVQTFDRVISTLPTRLTCRLVPALPDAYRARYDWGRAYGAHCLILALDRNLTGDSYWMNVNDPGYPFMVLVEHTNYMPREDYGGRTLIYLGNYRAMDDPLFQASKDDVLRDFLPHLKRINPAFAPEWVTDSWLFSAPFAQPIVTTAYKAHIPPFESPLDGLYLANMFQVYPHDRGQNYSIELAEKLVAALEGRAPAPIGAAVAAHAPS